MDVSIIIPFFNSAPFIDEAVHSAEVASMGFHTEIIIVDDGSTQRESLDKIDQTEAGGLHKIVRRPNGGPAAARNTGVRASKGRYLLFLDSDNKLKPDFLRATFPILESDSKAGVVYGDAAAFGEAAGRKLFSSHPFDKYSLLLDNYIDVCSLVRRETYDAAGGFDEDRLIIGYEDWEFWISVSQTPWQFTYLPQLLFDYRLRKQSVITEASTVENYSKVLKYVMARHASFFQACFSELYHESQFYKFDKERPFRSYIKYLKKRYVSGS